MYIEIYVGIYIYVCMYVRTYVINYTLQKPMLIFLNVALPSSSYAGD